MNRQEALKLLLSTDPQERLSATRWLYDHANADEIQILRARLLVEDDAWVQTSLRRILDRLETGGRVRQRHWIALPEEESLRDSKAKAVEEVSKMMLHEIRKIVGVIEISSAAEVDNFQSSKTKRSIERMKIFLQAIQMLHDASVTPQLDEIDLTVLIDEVVRGIEEPASRISLARTDSVEALVDPNLLTLALDNTIRNGLEACEAVDSAVTINWGVTDRDAWVMILDDGVGLPDGFAEAANPGRTTKSQLLHLGWGLTITRQAMSSLNGSVELRPRRGRGTACELRWITGELSNENAAN